jgi:hypothetical protein
VRGKGRQKRKGVTGEAPLSSLYGPLADPVAGPVISGRQLGAVLAGGTPVAPRTAGRRRVLGLGSGLGSSPPWPTSGVPGAPAARGRPAAAG